MSDDAARAQGRPLPCLPHPPTTLRRYSLSEGRYKRLRRLLARVQRGNIRHLPSADLDLFTDHPYPVLCDQTHGERVEAVLNPQDARGQAYLVVIGVSRDDGLSNDRSAVD